MPRECWTLEEVRKLVAACRSLPRMHPCGLRRSVWWGLAVRVAWDTGLRWGDMVRLRVDEIRGDLVIVGQRKTRRPVCGRLAPSTVAALRESLDACPRQLVAPWTASHETFNAQVRRLVAKAGIRAGTWKWLRRAGATDVEIQAPGRGMSSRHLGHAPGSRIAEIHYLDPAIIAAGVPMVSPREIGKVG
ncbi:MAG: tyrosine-type recombinase/integrase [Planctomycetia bacterium]